MRKPCRLTLVVATFGLGALVRMGVSHAQTVDAEPASSSEAPPAPLPVAADPNAAPSAPAGPDAAPAYESEPAPVEPVIPPPEAVPYRPVNVGLLYPMSTNVGAPDCFTHLDVAIMLGRIGYLGGFQIGPVGWVQYNMRGVQVGLVDVVEGNTEGIQLDAGFAITQGNLTGLQFVGALGWTSGNVTGIAIGGMGSQVYGNVDGALIGGGVTVARGRVRGMEIAGGVNIGRVDGLQLGLINVSAEVHGAQVGVINVARRLHGVQIGVLNVTDHLMGESLGVVPIPRRGGIHPVIWGSNTVFANLGLKFAAAYSYSLLSVGLHNRPTSDGKRKAAYATGFTLGARFLVATGMFVAGDLGAYRLFPDGSPWVKHDELYKLRVMLSFEIVKRLVPFIGAGLAVAVRGSDSTEVSFLPEGTAGLEL